MSNCLYCSRPAEIQQDLDVAVCYICSELLKNKVTALPLIRGHLTLTLRGKIPDADLKRNIDIFMSMIADWEPHEKN